MIAVHKRTPRVSKIVRFDDNFDAAVFFVAELLVIRRGVLNLHLVRNDKGRIDLSTLYSFEQRLHIAMHMGLAHPKGEALVHGGAEGELVDDADINAGDGDGAALATAEDNLAQDVGAIRSQEHGDFGAIQESVNATPGVRFGADGVNAAVRSSALGHFHQPVIDMLSLGVIVRIFLTEDDGFGFALCFGHAQAFWDIVNGDDASRAEHPRALDGELTHRPTSPHGDGIAGFDAAILGSHVSGGKNVGEEDDLFITKVGFDFQRPKIGEGDAEILRLSTWESAHQVRVAKQTGGRLAHHLLRHFGVGVGDVTKRKWSLAAKETFTAGDGEGNNDPVAFLKIFYGASSLDHDSHRLVTKHVTFLHGRHEIVVQVQI